MYSMPVESTKRTRGRSSSTDVSQNSATPEELNILQSILIFADYPGYSPAGLELVLLAVSENAVISVSVTDTVGLY